MSELSQTFTDKLFAEYEANDKFRALENAITHNGLLKSLETRQSEVENDHVFSIDLTKDEVANQKASGRCWMFLHSIPFVTNSFLTSNWKILNCLRRIPSFGINMKNQIGF